MRIVHKLLRKNSGAKISQSLITKQRLAVEMAYQIMVEYPKRAKTIGGKWAIYRYLRGVMLADEVGIGKTYEALALATLLYLKNTNNRKHKFRVLILAAPAIQSKWQWCSEQISLLSKCSSLCPIDCQDRDATNGDQCYSERGPEAHDVGIFLKNISLGKRRDDVIRLFSTLASHRIRSRRDWRRDRIVPGRQAVFMAGLQTFKRPSGRNLDIHFRNPRGRNIDLSLKENYFDLIIADEAHIARTGIEHEIEGRESRVALRKMKALLNKNPDAKIILLTATPFQNHAGELKRLLELLEYGPRNSGKENGKTIIEIIKQGLDTSKDQYDKLVDNLTTEGVKTMYKQADLDIDCDPTTHNRPKQLKDKSHKDEGLDDYLRDVMVRNRKKRIESEPISVDILKTAPASAVEYLFLRDVVAAQDAEAGDDDPSYFSTLLSELVSSEDALRHSLQGNARKSKIFAAIEKCFSGRSLFDMKRQRLLELLNRIQYEKRIGKKPVVTIFCFYIRTIKMLEDYLRKQKIPVYLFTGSDPKKLSDRTKRLEWIAKRAKGFSVLLVSQVGNEGLDFDSFSNTIIHYDGHFNPAVMDQRNGRVYRNNTKKEDIRSYRLQLGDTYDERITGIEMEKRKLKDFYLGDKTLGNLLNTIVEQHSGRLETIMKQVWQRFTIDLEPKEALLI